MSAESQREIWFYIEIYIPLWLGVNKKNNIILVDRSSKPRYPSPSPLGRRFRGPFFSFFLYFHISENSAYLVICLIIRLFLEEGGPPRPPSKKFFHWRLSLRGHSFLNIGF